jgi:hypothetical protein
MQFLVVLLFLVFEFLFAFVVVVAAATVGSGILFIVFWFLAMVVFCGVFFSPTCDARKTIRSTLFCAGWV